MSTPGKRDLQGLVSFRRRRAGLFSKSLVDCIVDDFGCTQRNRIQMTHRLPLPRTSRRSGNCQAKSPLGGLLGTMADGFWDVTSITHSCIVIKMCPEGGTSAKAAPHGRKASARGPRNLITGFINISFSFAQNREVFCCSGWGGN